MNVTPKQACSATLGTSLTAKATVPTGKIWRICAATVLNTHTSSVTLTLHLVPSGGSADDTNIVYKALSINAGATVVLDALLNQVMPAAMAIHASGSTADKLTLIVSASEVAA